MTRRPTTPAVLLASCLLSGCLLTPWMQSLYDPERIPDKRETVVELDVESAVLSETGETIAIGVTSPDSPAVPGHLRGDGLHIVARRTRNASDGALPDPKFVTLAAFNGDHMRREGFNLQVVGYGLVPAERLCRVVPRTEVPLSAKWREVERDGLLVDGVVDRLLRGFDRHRWLSLHEIQPNEGPQTALTWLDENGEQRSGPEVRDAVLSSRAAGWRLLARVDRIEAEPSFVTIPVPVLLAAESLQLRPSISAIAFRRTEHWSAKFERHPTIANPQPIQLAANVMSYHWIKELDTREPLAEFLLAVLTPITQTIDFLILSNPTLVGLYELFREFIPGLPQPRIRR